MQTAGDGKPLGFCFARVERTAGSLRRAHAASIRSVFRSAVPSPTLVIGLADELPSELFASDIRIGVPLCRISRRRNLPGGGRGSADHEIPDRRWQAEPTDPQSEARQLLEEAMQRSDPLEPLRRAADAVNEALSDTAMQGWAHGSELAVVVDLSANAGLSQAGPRASGTAQPLAERLRTILAAPQEDPVLPWTGRLAWPAELMPFQRDGVAALLTNERLLLADDMGLGKTVQAIAAVRILRAKGAIARTLVAAPVSLLDQWRSELHRWAPELSAIIVRGPARDRVWQWAAAKDVTLVGYETLRSDATGGNVGPAARGRWDLVIADEAQRIKNRNQTSGALKRLARVRSWALTGTPLENHEDELASIIEFVDYVHASPAKRYRPGNELRARHGELQVRRRKLDVLQDLPPKRITTLATELKGKQRASYERLERKGIVFLKSLGADVRVHHVLELITRLKQICNADPSSGESSKLDDIASRLEELAAEGHKALVFSQFTSEAFGVAAVAKRLRAFRPLAITGATPLAERTEIVRQFKTEADRQVLVLSLRVGGLGLNLQEASYVFHLDRWWNPATELQAEDRTHRFGQSVKVNVFKYSCVGTIEERIDEVLRRKRELFDELVDDVSLDLSLRMSQDELFGLFGLGS